MNITESATADLAEMLQAGREAEYLVTTTTEGWIEIRNNPARQIDPSKKLDFLRIAGGEGEWTLYHLTPKGICQGQATFVGSFTSALYGAVIDFFETL